MEKLTSWVGLGSEVFPNELRHAVRTRDEAVLGQDCGTAEEISQSVSKEAKATKDTVRYNCNKKGHFALVGHRRITPKEKEKARLLLRLPTTAVELT